jgi:hypothetical protein
MEDEHERDHEGRPVLRGIELRSLLVLLLLDRRAPATVGELVRVVQASGFSLPGRPSKTTSDALRWEVARGRAVRVRHDGYVAGHVAKVTRHRMRARVAATRNRTWS